jgi:hypothetical protein
VLIRAKQEVPPMLNDKQLTSRGARRLFVWVSGTLISSGALHRGMEQGSPPISFHSALFQCIFA